MSWGTAQPPSRRGGSGESFSIPPRVLTTTLQPLPPLPPLGLAAGRVEVPGNTPVAEQPADGARSLGRVLGSGCLLRGSAPGLDALTGCLVAWRERVGLCWAGDTRAAPGFQKIQCPQMGTEWQRQEGGGQG